MGTCYQTPGMQEKLGWLRLVLREPTDDEGPRGVCAGFRVDSGQIVVANRARLKEYDLLVVGMAAGRWN